MRGDSLGDRMKDYESISRTRLPRRSWVIIRLDGKAFHTFTRGLERPYSAELAEAMDLATKALCERVEGCVYAYTQSDEISLILPPGNRQTQPWFDGQVQKIASVTASIVTAHFNVEWGLIKCSIPDDQFAYFDSRVFTVPSASEVTNYLLWRQQDAVRNSISMAAQSQFSHKSLQGLSSNQLQDKLFTEKGINWNDYPSRFKRGGQVVKAAATKLVKYTDKRDGELHQITVDRTEWRIQPADEFKFDTLVTRFDRP